MPKEIVKVESPKKTATTALKELKNEKVKTPGESAEATTKELARLGLKPTESFRIKNPITGKEATVQLSRTGVQEADLIMALADPNVPRDQKDHALSMYLWGRGAESASMIVDIMRYKGEHTKETRVFKSQMRFDFEAFVKMTSEHLREQAERTASMLGIDLKEEISAFRTWLELPNNKGMSYTYRDFVIATCDGYEENGRPNASDRSACALISQAIFDLGQAQRLDQSRDNIAKAREREKGGGIYVDSKGRSFAVDDPQMDDVVKADREATKDIEYGNEG